MTKSSNAARTAETTPNLRERAERLRDATGRFIRRTPVEPARDTEDAAAFPELVSMVAEWTTLQNEMTNAASMTNEELDPKCDRANELHAMICGFEARTLADMAVKLPIYEDEHAELQRFELGSQVEHAWGSVVRDLKVLSGNAAAPDPILAAIAETRRLTTARTNALSVDLPPGTGLPPGKWSSLRYGFAPCGGCHHGTEEAYG